MLPVWLFDFLRFNNEKTDDETDDEKTDDEKNTKKCICSKSFVGNKPIMCEYCFDVQCSSCWLFDDGKTCCPNCFNFPNNSSNNLSNNQIVPYMLLNDENSECAICMQELSHDDTLLSCGHSMCCYDFMKYYGFYNVPSNEQIFQLQNPIKCILCRQSVNRVALNGFKMKEVTKKTPIEIWDLRFLFMYLKQENILYENTIKKAIAEYRNFMFAKQQIHDNNGLLLSPCPIVDTIWHTHILFTENYQQFCDAIIGFFVHHRPNGKYETEQKQERLKQTIKWFRDNNVVIDDNIWSNNNENIKICVKTSTLRIKYYTVSLDSKIYDIKSMLYNDWACTPCDQRIIWAGKEFDDDVKIKDIYNKWINSNQTNSNQNNSTQNNELIMVFYMMLKLKGC